MNTLLVGTTFAGIIVLTLLAWLAFGRKAKKTKRPRTHPDGVQLPVSASVHAENATAAQRMVDDLKR
jgi:hypothetical protein